MFGHIFRYKIKSMLGDKSVMFWTVLFPLLLATMFHFSFGSLESSPSMEIIPVAVVGEGEGASVLSDALEATELFRLQHVERTQAEDLLRRGEIKGIVLLDGGELSLQVSSTGLEENILKTVLDSYQQTTAMVTDIILENPAAIQKGILEDIASVRNYTASKEMENGNAYVIFFYALLAMVSLMSGTGAAQAVWEIQSDQSLVAARVNFSPVKKMKIYAVNMLCTTLFYFVVVLLAVAYIRFVLGVEFGNTALVILMCLVGCLAGITLNSMLFALIKGSEGLKMGILIGVNLTSCFLAGMMVIDVKYLVQKAFPHAALLNPATLIADGLYALYYYPTHEIFTRNVLILLGMSVLFGAVTILKLRRQSYESI